MPSRNPGSRASLPVYAALCAVLVLSACAAHYVQVAPRMDLGPYGRIALVTFRTGDADSSIATLATRRFAEAVLDGQGGIEVLELNGADTALRAMLTRGDAAAVAQALGRDKEIPAVFLGTLTVTDAKPSGHISTTGLNVRTTVSAELSVQLLSTSTGGTMWRSSARADGTVGRASLIGRRPSISMRSEDEAYGQVVDQLVANVTRDFRPTLVKQ